MVNWLFDDKPLDAPPNGAVGFVYLITNNITNKKYIGRKYFETIRRVKQKNKQRRKVVKKESNWREYTSSSNELNDDIIKFGINNFKFEILQFGNTRGEVNYLEENLQHKFDVLTRVLANGEFEFYNSAIGSRKFLGTKHTPPEKQIISEIVRKRFG